MYHVILFLHVLSQISTIYCTNYPLKGFSTNFIHRDSPQSPLYDPSVSQKDRSNVSIQRSISRLVRFNLAHNLEINYVKEPTDEIKSTIFLGAGEYLMEFYVGTPPFKQLAIADTGSDITWTQCLPCEICYKQNQPIFNSENSSTFREILCDSSKCGDLGMEKSCGNATCKYRLSYGDLSSSNGVLATETYTIGGTSIPNLAYGCSHASQGTFQPDSSGIVGLGGGALSLINQLRMSIPRKFSYCLLSANARVANVSSIHFGLNAIVSGPNVSSTPLVKGDIDTYYYLTLEAMSVGNSRFNYNGTTIFGKPGPIKEGNIIIDSGTTITFLPLTLCNNLVDSMKSAIKATPIPDPQNYFNLCYKLSKHFTAPIVTVHFAGGVNLKLRWPSTFYITDRVACLAFMESQGLSIYGNLAQRNYLIGYDIENQIVSFKPADCSKE